MQTVVVSKRGEDAVSTMNEDEEMRRQLKYTPQLESACKKWIEGT